MLGSFELFFKFKGFLYACFHLILKVVLTQDDIYYIVDLIKQEYFVFLIFCMLIIHFTIIINKFTRKLALGTFFYNSCCCCCVRFDIYDFKII